MAVIEKLLKQLGVPQSQIKEVMAAEADNKEDFDLTPIVTSYKESQKALYENDAEIEEKFRGFERAKIQGIITQKLKREFGLSSEHVKDKKLEEIIEIAKTESQKNGSKELTQIQEELLAANNKLKEYDEVLIPGVKAEVEKEKKAFRINNDLQKLIPQAEKLRVPSSTVQKFIDIEVKEKYDLDIDEKGNVNIYQKGTKLHVKNADGTKLLSINDAIEEVLKTNNFLKESNADDGPGGGSGAGGSGTKKFVQPTKEELAKMTPGQRKAMEHAAELEAKRLEAEKSKTQ